MPRKITEADFFSEDLHIQTAARIFNIPAQEVTPEQRDVGKKSNFNKLYSKDRGRRWMVGPKIERLKDELFEILLSLHDHEYSETEKTLMELLAKDWSEREDKKS